MPRKLVIVESPAKARTLAKILGGEYDVQASIGHVRDLPRQVLGVDIEHDFTPRYTVVEEKRKTIRLLKEAANTAASIYLATDPDREGEAISWHLVEAAQFGKDRIPIRRVVFHEITKEAVEQAFHNPRSIDMDLVNAQQARRILDRLVGYKLSPLLWRKVRKGLSAGRVQSSALKLIADRDNEIAKFTPKEYWTIKSQLAGVEPAHQPSFWAELVGLFDGEKLTPDSAKEAGRLADELHKAVYQVTDIRVKETAQQPAPPFITSTLQQEAWRKLRFSGNRTMRIAQQLYEGLSVGEEGSVGLITYMRTDSTHVAPSALAEIRDLIVRRYGKEFLPPSPRRFTKKAKLAQEAHEAIRPTKVEHDPASLQPYLSQEQLKLYELVWKRMVASQMTAALSDSTAVDVKADPGSPSPLYLLRATSSIVKFPGFTVLYTEGKDEDGKTNDGKTILPDLRPEEPLELLDVSQEQHFTKPPPRYTEATLIKALEQKGIGRPSTYASIVSVIQERGYVKRMQANFHPTELGMVVNDLLERHFPAIVNLGFTARMEEDLDRIAQGVKEWVSVLRDFYTPFETDLEKAFQNISRVKLPEEPSGELCSKCGKDMVIKTGKFGKFLGCSGFPHCGETSPYYIKLGIACPECGGELVERETKKRRIFYGCSTYPNCTFSTNRRPIASPCPKCRGLLTLLGRGKVKCAKCNYAGALADEVPDEQTDEQQKSLSPAGRKNKK